MNERHQTLHNAIFNALGRFFSIALSFFFMPYIVHELGPEAYGIYILIFAVIGYFGLLDLDLGQAIIKYVAEYKALDDFRGINRVVGATLFLYLLMGIIGGLTVFFCADLIACRFLKIQHDLLPMARFTFRVASLGFVFTMLLSAFSSIPKALNRYDISSKLTIVVSLVTTLSTVLLLYLHFGLREIVILDVVISFSSLIVYMIIGKRLLPQIRYRPYVDPIALKKVLPFGLYSSLGRISYIIQFQLDRIFTGVILGASSVTFYFVPFNLVSKAVTLTSQLSGVIMPLVSGLDGKKDFDSLIRVYLKSSRLIAAIASSVCLPLFLFGDRFLSLWMGEEFARESGSVLMFITLALYADAFTNIPSFVVQGLGKPKITGFFAMANAVINLTLLFPLARIMGLNGIALAFLISSAGIAPVFIYYANNRVLHFSFARLLREGYALPVTGTLLVGLPLSFFPTGWVDNIFVLLAMMGAVTVLYLLISIWIGAFTRDELTQFKDYVQGSFRRLRTLFRKGTSGQMKDRTGTLGDQPKP
ncbi:MAG: flippase [Deltaproteobacteria bacterium]|nr:flippase [Deltaproteobacteria bacterium]